MNIYPIRCDGDDVLKYIYPLKQKAAQKAIELARADSRIKRVIVFGSALTMKCGMLSDIDIALDVPDISEDDFARLARPFFIQIPSEVDVVHYNTIKSELFKQNVEKGVCIQRQKIKMCHRDTFYSMYKGDGVNPRRLFYVYLRSA